LQQVAAVALHLRLIIKRLWQQHQTLLLLLLQNSSRLKKCNRVCVRYFFAGFASPKKIKIFFVALFRLQQFIAIAQHTLFTHNRAVRIYFNVSGFSILPKFICLLTVLFIK
jgi:hypothetical protein